MYCPNCQRPLPDTMVCSHCTNHDDTELSLAPLEDLPPPPVAPTPSSTDADVDTGQPIQLEPVKESAPVSCENCHTDIPAGKIQCPSCGYNTQLGRRLDAFELDDFGDAMGFDRYLMRHTSKNDPDSIVLWFRIFMAFLLVALIVIARDFMSVVVSGIVIGVYIAYLKTMGSSASFHQGRSVIPRIILLANRLAGWKNVTELPKGASSVITKRGGSYGDEQLAAIEDVNLVEVLDAPETQITDTGILYLQRFPHLKALMIRGCNVSDDALDQLQRTNKDLLIWR